MTGTRRSAFSFKTMTVSAVVLAVAAVAIFGVVHLAAPIAAQDKPAQPPANSAAAPASADEGGDASQGAAQTTGLPIPRFVSLKSETVNVRRGPSQTHQVAWVFSKKGLPVEVVAEYELWRRVRDSEGEEGWVFHALLSNLRTGLVAPWKKGKRVHLYGAAGGEAEAVAVVESGVLGRVLHCTGEWCEFATAGYTGWVRQTQLWGVYPGEKVN